VHACPTSIDIPEFIRKISTGNVKGSARTIFDANILGMSCARVCPVEVLCVGKCVYNHEDIPPIEIGRLQRYSTDMAFEKDWTFWKPGAPTGKKVAFAGAGPASLAAAHELRKYGHECVIFEKRDLPGGLNTTGVAPYKMIADASLAEVAWITDSMGIEVRCGVEIGKDVTWDSLLDEYDAVFVGLGLGPDSHLGLGSDGLPGIIGGVEVIERWKVGGAAMVEGVEHAVVIGGGNTSLDVVRELLVLGIPNVTLTYRRTAATMPGYEHEWEYARVEGAEGSWNTQPVGFDHEDGKLAGVRCRRTEPDPADPSGRRLREVEGSDFVIRADLAVVAVGQGKLGELLASIPGVELEWGKLMVDEDGRSGNPRIFAGGDVANGGKEVVNAAAEGKRAAHAMHQLLS
jgi:glutamate synthase (NADPH/NADH) small chain